MRIDTIWFIFKNSIQNAFLFKGSFLIKIITVLLSQFSSLYVMILLLSRFQGYAELTSGQFLFLYVFSHISYSFCMIFFSNLRRLGLSVQKGTLDKVLTLPVDTMMYFCINAFDIANIGEIVTYLFLYIIFRNSFGIQWDAFKIGMFVILLLSSILLLAALIILLSSVAFFVVDWKPLDNMFNAIKEMLWYPLSIYNCVVQFILYTFIPVAYIVYVPVKLLYGEIESVMEYAFKGGLLFCFSILLFWCSYHIWFKQLGKYQSVG